jgi:hypothetical protein
MSTITGETTLLKSVRSRAVVLHDDSFVEDYPVVTIKDMVINNRDDVKTVRDDFKITRDHKRLLTVHQDKDYRIVFDKRVVMQDYSTREGVREGGREEGYISCFHVCC